MHLMKLVCAIFPLYQNVFCCFFQASEEGKSDNDNDFKISWATYCSTTILDCTIKQNEIFEIRIFSHPLNFFSLLSNLILYSQNKLSRKYLLSQHISPLKRPLKNVSPWTCFRGFSVTYFNCFVDSTNL